MAGEEESDGLFDRILPLFEHTHDAGTTAIVVAFAAVVGLLAGWITADLGVRFLAFVVGAVGSGYLLYDQRTRRDVVVAGLYSIAALLAAAPFIYELGTLLYVEAPLRHLLSVADLLVFVAFWLLAAIPAVVGYRLTSGPFVKRLLR